MHTIGIRAKHFYNCASDERRGISFDFHHPCPFRLSFNERYNCSAMPFANDRIGFPIPYSTLFIDDRRAGSNILAISYFTPSAVSSVAFSPLLSAGDPAMQIERSAVSLIVPEMLINPFVADADADERLHRVADLFRRMLLAYLGFDVPDDWFRHFDFSRSLTSLERFAVRLSMTVSATTGIASDFSGNGGRTTG